MSRSGRQVRESGRHIVDQTITQGDAARGSALGAVALAATATVGALWSGSAFAKGNIKVQNVAAGSAKIQINGRDTVITAANRTIINFSTFNIAGNESVRFVQPGRQSTVLNRINSADPSHIDGRLTANGIVYFVNPAGVTFGANSVVNVGTLYAAASNLSDADFRAGNNHFLAGDTGGMISNAGVIKAQQVYLIGRQVSNSGAIMADKVVTMASGNDVLIGDASGGVFVNVAPVTKNPAAAAPHLGLGAGDMYSVATHNSGSIKAPSITLQTATGGATIVGGSLDASNTHAGKVGGSITVTGGDVSLTAATIDASGSAGGGYVKIGGDFHGAGATATASSTTIDAASSIHADALKNGSGGKVVVWSDGHTEFAGAITARGGIDGGDGGSAEVSGHATLGFTGTADLTAPKGITGSLLLDPDQLTVGAAIPVAFTPTADAANGVKTDADFTAAPELNALIGTLLPTGTLTGILATANVTLEATKQLTIASAVTPAAGTFTLMLVGGTGVNINAPITMGGALTLTATTGNISVTSNIQAGSFQATAGNSFASTGHSIVAVTGGITIQANGAAGDLSTGVLSTSGQTIKLTSANTMTIGGSLGSTGGDVTAMATGALNINASVTTGGIGKLTATAGSITSSAAAHLVSGAGDVSLTATAGDIKLKANADVSGTFTASATGAVDTTASAITAAGNVKVTANSGLSGTSDAALSNIIATGAAATITVINGGTGNISTVNSLTAPGGVSLTSGGTAGTMATPVSTVTPVLSIDAPGFVVTNTGVLTGLSIATSGTSGATKSLTDLLALGATPLSVTTSGGAVNVPTFSTLTKTDITLLANDGDLHTHDITTQGGAVILKATLGAVDTSAGTINAKLGLVVGDVTVKTLNGTTAEDVTVGAITGQNVNLTATGAISDNTGATITSGATVTAKAVTGITLHDVEAVTGLIAQTTGAVVGDITVSSAGALPILQLSTQNGSISASTTGATGDLTVVAAGSGGLGVTAASTGAISANVMLSSTNALTLANDVTATAAGTTGQAKISLKTSGSGDITQTTGNVTASTVDATSGGVDVNSAGAIIHAAGKITGRTISLTAGANKDIGAASGVSNNPVATATTVGGALTIKTIGAASGSSFVNEDNGVVLTDTAGAGSITFSGALATTGPLTVAKATAGGDIGLTNNGSILNSTSVTTTIKSTGGKTSVTATGTGSIGSSLDATTLTTTVGTSGPLNIDSTSTGIGSDVTIQGTSVYVHLANASVTTTVLDVGTAPAGQAVFDRVPGGATKQTYTLKYTNDLTVSTPDTITDASGNPLTVPGTLTLISSLGSVGAAALPVKTVAPTVSGASLLDFAATSTNAAVFGPVLAGGQINLATTHGDLTISKDVDASLYVYSDVSLSAGRNIVNTGGRVWGNTVTLTAGTDAASLTGAVGSAATPISTAAHTLVLTAKNDLINVVQAGDLFDQSASGNTSLKIVTTDLPLDTNVLPFTVPSAGTIINGTFGGVPFPSGPLPPKLPLPPRGHGNIFVHTIGGTGSITLDAAANIYFTPVVARNITAGTDVSLTAAGSIEQLNSLSISPVNVVSPGLLTLSASTGGIGDSSSLNTAIAPIVTAVAQLSGQAHNGAFVTDISNILLPASGLTVQKLNSTLADVRLVDTAGDVTVTTSGVNAANGTVGISLTTANATLTNQASIVGKGNTPTLFDSLVGVTLTADQFVSAAAATIDSTATTTTIKPFTPTRQIVLGDTGAGVLLLHGVELSSVTGSNLVVGDELATNAGSISFHGPTIDLTATVPVVLTPKLGQLTLATSGSVSDDGSATPAVATSALAIVTNGAASAAGTVANPLDLAVGQLAVKVGTGGINIRNTATDLTVADLLNGLDIPQVPTLPETHVVGLKAVGTATLLQGDITLANAGNLHINAAVNTTNEGSVSLSATGGNTLAINSAVTTEGLVSGGNIAVSATSTGAMDLTLKGPTATGTGSLTSSGTGNITVTAVGGISMDQPTFVSANTGTIVVKNTGIAVPQDITLASLQSKSSASPAVTVTSMGGIYDTANYQTDTKANIIAPIVKLSAQTGIGGSDPTAADTAGKLAPVSVAAQTITADDVTDVPPVTMPATTAAQALAINLHSLPELSPTAGAVTVPSITVSGDGGIQLLQNSPTSQLKLTVTTATTFNGNITLGNDGGTINGTASQLATDAVTAGNGMGATVGTVTLSSTGDILSHNVNALIDANLTAGQHILKADSTVSGGDSNLTAGTTVPGNITFGTVNAGNITISPITGGNANLTATGGSGVTGGSITGGAVRALRTIDLEAGNDPTDTTPNTILVTSLTAGSVVNSTIGTVTANAGGNITADTLRAINGGASLAGGDITVDSTKGNVLINGTGATVASVFADRDASITAGGSITINQPPLAISVRTLRDTGLTAQTDIQVGDVLADNDATLFAGNANGTGDIRFTTVTAGQIVGGVPTGTTDNATLTAQNSSNSLNKGLIFGTTVTALQNASLDASVFGSISVGSVNGGDNSVVPTGSVSLVAYGDIRANSLLQMNGVSSIGGADLLVHSTHGNILIPGGGPAPAAVGSVVADGNILIQADGLTPVPLATSGNVTIQTSGFIPGVSTPSQVYSNFANVKILALHDIAVDDAEAGAALAFGASPAVNVEITAGYPKLTGDGSISFGRAFSTTGSVLLTANRPLTGTHGNITGYEIFASGASTFKLFSPVLSSEASAAGYVYAWKTADLEADTTVKVGFTEAFSVRMNTGYNVLAGDVIATADATLIAGDHIRVGTVNGGADVKLNSGTNFGVNPGVTGNIDFGNVTSTGSNVTMTAVGDINGHAALSPSPGIVLWDSSVVAAKNASLTAGGSITLESVTAGIDASLTATKGSITVTSVTATSGDASLNAGGDIGVGSVGAGNDATLVAGSNITAGTVDAGRDAALTAKGGDLTSSIHVIAGRDISLTAGHDVLVNLVRVGIKPVLYPVAHANLTAGHSIKDLNGALVNIDSPNQTAASPILVAKAGTALLGTTNNITLDTNVAKITAKDLGTGMITLNSLRTGAGVDVELVDVSTAGGPITVTAVSQLTATSVIGHGGDVKLSNMNGNILVGLVEALGSNTQLASLTTTTNRIEQIGASDATPNIVSTGTINLKAGSGIGSMGLIDVTAPTLIGSTDSGDLKLHSIATAPVTATLSVNTGAGNIVLNQDGNQTLNVKSATTFDGNITLDNKGADMTLTLVAAHGSNPMSGQVTATTEGSGSILVDTVSATGKDITLTSAGNIADINGPLRNVTGKELLAKAVGFIELDTALDNITAQSTGAGDITFRELDAVTLDSITTASGKVNVMSGGTMTVKQIHAAGDVTLLTTGGDIATDTIVANGSLVKLTAAGSITDINGDGVLNVTAHELRAMASGLINLDTALDNITAESTGTGDITFRELDAVTLDLVKTHSGKVTVTSGSTLTVKSIQAAGDVKLTTKSSDIATDSIVANGSVVTMMAAGSITDINGDGVVNVTAKSLDATASAGIKLDTNLSDITAKSQGSGTIDLQEVASNTPELKSITTGGMVRLRGNGGFLVDYINAGDIVDVTAAGNIIPGNAGAGRVNITAPQLKDSSAGISVIPGKPLTTDIQNLTAHSTGGDINLFNRGNLTVDKLDFAGSGSLVLAAGSNMTAKAPVPGETYSTITLRQDGFTGVTTNNGGTQDYRGNVVLSPVATGTPFTFTAGGVTFNGTVDSDSASTHRDLVTMTTGIAEFFADVGGKVTLASFTTGSDGTTKIHGKFTAEKTIAFNDNTVLTDGAAVHSKLTAPAGVPGILFGRKRTLTFAGPAGTKSAPPTPVTISTDGSSIAFQGSELSATKGAALVTTTGGNATFDGPISNTTAGSVGLTIDASILGQPTLFGGNVKLSAAAQLADLTVTGKNIDVYTVAASGNITLTPDNFMRAVSVPGLSSTGAVVKALVPEGIIRISGGNLSAGGNITLGADRALLPTSGKPKKAAAGAVAVAGTDIVAETATILAPMTTTIDASHGTFRMGRGEKLTVAPATTDPKALPTDLTITADQAFLSDLTVFGNLTVTMTGTHPAVINYRPAQLLLNNQTGNKPVVGSVPDKGADFFANGNINFNKQPVADLSSNTGDFLQSSVRFGTGTGKVEIGKLPYQFNGKVFTIDKFFANLANFGGNTDPTSSLTALDATPAGPSSTVLTSVLAQALPTDSPQPTEEENISGALREQLRSIGIFARDLSTSEQTDRALGRILYLEVPMLDSMTGAQLADEKFTVVGNRLPRRLAKMVVDSFDTIYGSNPLTNEPLTADEKIKAMNSVPSELIKAFDAYVKTLDANTGEFDPAGFRQFIDSDKKYEKLSIYLDRVQRVFSGVENLGLTEAQWTVARKKVISQMFPNGTEMGSFEQIVKIIRTISPAKRASLAASARVQR